MEFVSRVLVQIQDPGAISCATTKRCSPSWARLIAKVYHVDPLVCTRCGQRMSVIALVTVAVAD